MVGADIFLTVIFVWFFALVLNSGVDGSGESCPKGGVVDLTEETPESFRFVNKSGIIFPRNSTWSINGKTFGCTCDFRSCVPLCCPMGLAASLDGCFADELTALGFDGFESYGERAIPIGNPCDSMWKDFASRPKDGYGHSEDVVLISSILDQLYQLDDFCFYREPNSTIFTAFFCEDPAVLLLQEIMDIWALVCDCIAVFFMLVTFIVYSVVPELRNLQGLMILNCLASYITSRFLDTLRVIIYIFSLYRGVNFSIGLGLVRDFCDFAYIMWLNVMSYDIWKKFRTIQSSPDIDIARRQRATFCRYSIYVWCTSIVAVVINLIWLHLPTNSYNESETERKLIIYLYGVPGAIVFLSNTCFYTITALKIKQLKKETEHIVGGANKHHRESKKWFNLNLKLFIMSGCPMVLWAVFHLLNNEIFKRFANVSEAVQGFFIFLMFVWKDDVRSSIGKLFSGMLARLGGSCPRHDGNEEHVDATSMTSVDISRRRSKY